MHLHHHGDYVGGDKVTQQGERNSYAKYARSVDDAAMQDAVDELQRVVADLMCHQETRAALVHGDGGVLARALEAREGTLRTAFHVIRAGAADALDTHLNSPLGSFVISVLRGVVGA